MGETRFKVGDVAWVPRLGNQEVKVVCPICFGKLEVKLTLGDGTEVMLPCGYCGHGYEGPRGFVMDWVDEVHAEMVFIDAVEVVQKAKGDEVRYQQGCWSFEECWATKEEALEAGKRLTEQNREELEKRAEFRKADVNKSYAWNAGYHMRQVKDHEKQAAYHREKARLCKEKDKSDGHSEVQS